jgi:hypothetical protein
VYDMGWQEKRFLTVLVCAGISKEYGGCIVGIDTSLYRY